MEVSELDCSGLSDERFMELYEEAKRRCPDGELRDVLFAMMEDGIDSVNSEPSLPLQGA